MDVPADAGRILAALPERRQTLLFSATFSPEIRALMRLIAEARVPCLSIMNMPPLPYLARIPGLDTDALKKCYTDPTVWEVAATGFRDTSRVAASDVTMMLDILMTNQRQVGQALHACIGQLQRLVRLVEDGDEERLREELAYIRKTRKEMYP